MAHRPTRATGGERERMRWENQPRALRGAAADSSGCPARVGNEKDKSRLKS